MLAAGHRPGVEVVAELPSDLMIAEANIRVSDATGGSGNIFEDLVSSAVRLKSGRQRR